MEKVTKAVLVWVFITVKRHHHHGNSYKRKHFIGGSSVAVSDAQSIIIMTGSMVACRQTDVVLED